jgi:glycosyltransferase involved in cell wall biosynthesis
MEYPFFSIIVPTHNRHKQLGLCLEAIAQMDYPLNCFEVIVVDDGSKEPPATVTDMYQGRFTLTLITQLHTGAAGARNNGASKARGQFLAFTDDDCTPDPKWLQALAAVFLKATDIAIGGRTVNALSDNIFATASQFIHDRVYNHYNTNPDQAQFFASSNLALPKDLFLAIGGFDIALFPDASEDRDLCNRWLHHGHRMVYAPDALVYHSHHLTLSKFIKQHYRYGRGAFRYHRSCIRRDSKHTIVKMPFYLNLLRDLIPMAVNPKTLPLTTMLVLWQTANTAGYFWEWARQQAGTRDWRQT